MKTVTIEATGTSPLLMHSDKLANPLHPSTKKHKKMTSNKRKTDEDHEAIMLSEWIASLYYDDAVGVHIPAMCLEACLRESAKLRKLGKQFQRGMMVMEDKIKLQYDGPKDIEKLKKDMRFMDVRSVKVQRAKLMRCRPIFNDWSFSCEVAYDESQINDDDMVNVANDAGRLIGLLDYRPRFGRFEVEIK